MDVLKIKMLVQHVSLAAMGGALLLGSNAVFADKDHDDDKSYTLQGACAFLPAARATEFHGNADRSKLNLAMAGNQWVVAEKAIQDFNVYINKGDGSEPAYRDNSSSDDTPDVWTLAALNEDSNRLYAQYIPPGQLRKQIKSGCMTLGNDEDRNFLSGNVQVDFDVFASTNYKLMQDLANNGFIDEAVPYIANRLDLMVSVGNPAAIGVGASDYDKLFDTVMDLLSGDIVASNLDHINEGIHAASNGWMGKAHDYLKANDSGALIPMVYTLGDEAETAVNDTMTASEWIQTALAAVATPADSSPGAKRLTDSGDDLAGDSGEKHEGNDHDLASNATLDGKDQCIDSDDGHYRFCEFATLNKKNTHESRVHHVETPNGILGEAGYVPVQVGFVWITELAYQLTHENFLVQGMVGDQDIANLGIPNTGNANADKIYSLALLATSDNEKRGRQFIEFLRDTGFGGGQDPYIAGGFTGLTDAQLLAGKCYAKPVGGVSVATNRNGDGSCDDWLDNN